MPRKVSREESKPKPPIPVELSTLRDLARLAMVRSDITPIIFSWRMNNETVLSHLFTVPFWKGGIPILAYCRIDEEPLGYIAYRAVPEEEVRFTLSTDDTRYVFGAVVSVVRPPSAFKKILTTKTSIGSHRAIEVRTSDLVSVVRADHALSEEGITPHLWLASLNGKDIVGLLVPLQDYHDQGTLPFFIYTVVESQISKPFLKYSASSGREEIGFEDGINDMRFLYIRLVRAKRLPFVSISAK